MRMFAEQGRMHDTVVSCLPLDPNKPKLPIIVGWLKKIIGG